ncbi:MAG TPA: class I SAM-dependent methyltransferase [Thermoanaerobaculia bacterium]|jgi:SAM-dependent methyltransferase|nr:class I SAM-dependent methyltransferase [Thermoanaerobaculia bacterium]
MEVDGRPENLEELFSGRGPDAALSAPIAQQKKLKVKEFYDKINDSLSESIYAEDATFFNYGYVADERPRSAKIQLPPHWPNRNRIELVLELIGDCDLNDRDILDVGCGRGGTILTVDRFFTAGEIWGLDLSPSAVLFCQRLIKNPGIRFVNGESERLPFLDGFFDVVMNVESSCLYPDIYAFYREVDRVLGPGGRFLYTDLLPVEHMASYRSCLTGLGLTLERDQDITPNVLLSLDSIAQRSLEVHGAPTGKEVMEFFLATPGSKPYRDLQEGRLSYRIWQFKKGN